MVPQEVDDAVRPDREARSRPVARVGALAVGAVGDAGRGRVRVGQVPKADAAIGGVPEEIGGPVRAGRHGGRRPAEVGSIEMHVHRDAVRPHRGDAGPAVCVPPQKAGAGRGDRAGRRQDGRDAAQPGRGHARVPGRVGVDGVSPVEVGAGDTGHGVNEAGGLVHERDAGAQGLILRHDPGLEAGVEAGDGGGVVDVGQDGGDQDGRAGP